MKLINKTFDYTKTYYAINMVLPIDVIPLEECPFFVEAKDVKNVKDIQYLHKFEISETSDVMKDGIGYRASEVHVHSKMTLEEFNKETTHMKLINKLEIALTGTTRDSSGETLKLSPIFDIDMYLTNGKRISIKNHIFHDSISNNRDDISQELEKEFLARVRDENFFDQVDEAVTPIMFTL